SVDSDPVAVRLWLVTRDGFHFLFFYLSYYDFASHASGPEGAHGTLVSTDRAIASLFEAAGGPDAFLERYAVLLCSDHGQTQVSEAVRLEDAFADLRLHRRAANGRAEIVVTAAHRAGLVYRRAGCL